MIPRVTTAKRLIRVAEGGRLHRAREVLAVEEPLEIQLQAGGQSRTVAITMRTPGDDYELAAGFLYSEGIVAGREQLAGMTYCVDDGEQVYNTLAVGLRGQTVPELPRLERHFFIHSGCGICGTTLLDDLVARGVAPVPDGPVVSADFLQSLPARLRQHQPVFSATGGVHAAALFAPDGTLLVVREDIGRHNAVDKVIGWGVLHDRLPFHNHILLVSGRAGYELVQKAAVAGVPIFCAVSAPSSLAVTLAERFRVTLVAFLRAGSGRVNLYTRRERVRADQAPGSESGSGSESADSSA
jgi:FdhD protein